MSTLVILYLIIAASFAIATSLTLTLDISKELVEGGTDALTIVEGVGYFISYFIFFPLILLAMSINYRKYKDELIKGHIDD